MKRYILLLGALLLGCSLWSQSVTYSCRYWFDHNHTQPVTVNFSDSIMQAELDVGLLSNGLHTLYMQIADTSLVWNPLKSYMFFKTEECVSENLTYNCWFDQDISSLQSNTLCNGSFLLDVADLEEGMHTVNVVLQCEDLSVANSYMFLKVATMEMDSIDLSHLTYHCWFDQDIEHQQTDSLGDGHILLDVAGLEDGLHTVNVMLESSALNSPKTYMFMKMPMQDPTAEVQYHCWFDSDINTMQTGMVGGGVFELEVGDLANGLHTINVMLEGMTMNASRSYMFYKRPFGGSIAQWEYWLNDAFNDRHTTNLSPYVDTLSIITLLPLETRPIRSSCFHFHPNGDEPYINAKNEITFRFWDVDKHFIDKSSFYIDENIVEPIVADSLERNTTVSIGAPRNNQIHWFKIEANRGEYLSFQADKACTMQLFAPSGEEVYAASGPESIVLEGLNVWEDGTYYLAVHDVTGSGETVSLTYNWLNRYAIASYDVHLVGNGGCSTITFQGNGFNSLLDAYLVNWQNDTIRSLDIGHESNTTTTVSLNFYQENLGVYDAVFEFFEETIRINGALEVQEPVDIYLTSKVSYPSSFMSGTTVTYNFTITNNGNMSAYVVPVYLYISSPTLESITHLELEGLNLPSIYDYFEFDFDTLSLYDLKIIKDWAENLSDDHYFRHFSSVINAQSDTIAVRSNFFFVNLAPFETKTIKLKITATTGAHQFIGAWMTVPNEMVMPLTLEQNRGFREQYCCVQESITCWLDLSCNVLDLIQMLTATTPAAVATVIISCICNWINTINTMAGAYYCNNDATYSNNTIAGMWDMLSNFTTINSIAGTIIKCLPWSMISRIKDFVKMAKDILEIINNALSPIGGVNSMMNCYNVNSGPKPGCPPGDPVGGFSDGRTPGDPNDIHGYLSESGSHYMRQEIQNVQYEIEFENDTTLATAAAHTIIVRDTLDATKFDLNSLAARSVTIGSKRLDLNGEQTFARTLDLRPEIYVIAQINQDYDPTTGIIQWTIQSLDPMTMEPTDDPNQGVLPVNYYGDGVGFIDYSVDIKEPFADGTEISNRAGIIFDQEDQILTPTWTNIVDAVKPTSHIEEVTLTGDSLNFNFVSSDNRSGVWYHSLYYRNASTELEWLVKKAQILGNSFMLPFDSLQTTEYFVIAVDSAGNVEAMKTEAEVVVESSVSGYPFFVAGYGESTNAGWKFIASPVEGSIEAATVDNIFSATQSDLYYFDQGEESEWRNYKSAPFELENGKGYLYATKEDKTLIFRGTYNEADAYEVPLVYTGANPHTDMRGWNLIGNPFTVPAYVNRSYYKMNEDGTAIEPVAVSEGTPIPACHGMMVKAETSDETVTFSRTAQQAASNQGNIQIAVAQATMRGNIKQDKAVVSFNPNDQLGKFDFNESTAKVYIPQDGKDYAIAYAAKSGEIPVNFKATKNGEYTMNVNTNGKEFNYLHLIDNLTGADVDLLPVCKGGEGGVNEPQQATYTFTAKTTDYASRFRLVFSVCGDADGDNAPFAFINNGNIIIVGAEAGAILQIVDVLGRVLVCRDTSHVSAISTNGMAPGVYVLRLINGDDVKVQKIVVK